MSYETKVIWKKDFQNGQASASHTEDDLIFHKEIEMLKTSYRLVTEKCYIFNPSATRKAKKKF